MVRARLLLVAATTAAAVSWSSRARADLPAGSGTPSFELRILDSSDNYSKPNEQDREYYFNRAHCVCSEAAAGKEQDFQLFTQLSDATSPLHVPAQVWTGSSCDESQTTRDTNCQHVTASDISDYGAIATTPIYLQIPIGAVMDPLDNGCTDAVGTGNVWLLVDQSGTGGTLDKAGSTSIDFDMAPPPVPTSFTASGAENAIQIDFTPPVANATDVYYYQALCSVAGTDEVAITDESKRPTQRYFTVNDVCGLDANEVEITPVDVATSGTSGTPDAGVGPDAGTSSTTGAGSLLPKFLCGEAVGTANGIRIDNLQNGVAYEVVLLAVDLYGNARGVSFNQTLTPQPVTDFWEDLHDQGSGVQGGFCLISDTFGDGGPITGAMRRFRDDTLASSAAGRAFIRFYYAHVAWLGAYARAHWPVRIVFAVLLLPLVALALAWHALGLPLLLLLVVGLAWARRRWRRPGRPGAPRRRAARAALATTALALVWLRGGAAHAQGFTPYWEDEDAGVAPEGEAQPNWVLGVKLGPYVPGIDAQLGMTDGPYHQMFGGYNIMPILEVDRIVLRGFGQLTVGGSAGYLGKSAHAWVAGTTAGDPNRERSPGDTTSFRMIPLSATASYRVTYLDDAYGVPIVPYLRGGLSYDVWWVRQPSGDLARIGPDNCHPAGTGCADNKAIGATAGLQASIGLAVRAERIDHDALASMRGSGIEHAGFYAEYQLAWVTGFGNDKKLAVGDDTWFAGFNFEF